MFDGRRRRNGKSLTTSGVSRMLVGDADGSVSAIKGKAKRSVLLWGLKNWGGKRLDFRCCVVIIAGLDVRRSQWTMCC